VVLLATRVASRQHVPYKLSGQYTAAIADGAKTRKAILNGVAICILSIRDCFSLEQLGRGRLRGRLREAIVVKYLDLKYLKWGHFDQLGIFLIAHFIFLYPDSSL